MRKHLNPIIELSALVAAVVVVAIVSTVAPGSAKRADSFAPPVLGAQPPGAVVLAQEDKDLAVALALKPASSGLLAVVTVLGQDGEGAQGLSTHVSVHTTDGHTTAAVAEPGTFGTYQAVLATSARPTAATVTVDGPGASSKPLLFDLPTVWPPKPATALMKKVDTAYAQLKTLVTHERLASDPTTVVNSVYKAIAPSTLEITSSNGQRAIIIGDRRWDKQPGTGFIESGQSPPVNAIAPYWAGAVEDPTVLGATRVAGRPVWIVSFVAPQIPAFFEIDVDKATNRTLALRMTASAHFMEHRYGPFDSRLSVVPPSVKGRDRMNIGMRRRRAAVWLLSVPLMVAGSQTAHVLAYRIVYPQAQVRLRDLLSTGHGYMIGHPGWIAPVLGVLGGMELLGLGWSLVDAIGRRPNRPVPAYAFAVLPVLGFALQEFLERWLVGGSFPWWFVLQPTFRVGLLLQLPFALAVYAVARLLLRATERIAATFRPAAMPSLHRDMRIRWGIVEAAAVRSWLHAAGHFGRGPPMVSVGTAFA